MCSPRARVDGEKRVVDGTQKVVPEKEKVVGDGEKCVKVDGVRRVITVR